MDLLLASRARSQPCGTIPCAARAIQGIDAGDARLPRPYDSMRAPVLAAGPSGDAVHIMSILLNHGSWWVEFRYRGVRVRRRSPLNTPEGARDYEASLRSRLACGTPLDRHEVPTFQDFAQEWLAGYQKVHNKRSTHRKAGDLLRLDLLPYFGRMQLDSITQAIIERYKAELVGRGYANQTINNRLNILSGCLRFAHETDRLPVMPRIRRLRANSRSIGAVTLAEAELVLRHASEVARPMLLLAACTGMRIGEILALEWRDVDLEQGMIRVRQAMADEQIDTPKNHRERFIPMQTVLQEVLAPLHRPSGFVFERGGLPLTYSAARHLLSAQCRRAGTRRLTWHMFRHAFCTQLLNHGVNIRTAQDLMGHSSVTVTERYAHTTPADHREAVALLPFGRQGLASRAS